MYQEPGNEFSFDTEVTKQGAYITGNHSHPEAQPIFLTTAFNPSDLDALFDRYATGGYCYNRISSPNRNSLSEFMTYLEGGEASISCSSGMAAISTALIAHLKPGDHILSDKTLYGETFDLFEKVFRTYGVEYSCIDMTDLDVVKDSMKPNTKVVFTETASNPMITVVDLEALAKIAHSAGALLFVDNTFMTPYAVRPIEFGADLTINSITKFLNGHFDTVCGSITGKQELVKKCHEYQVILGSQADGFVSWMAMRGMRTFSLRIERQMANAAALAKALASSPLIEAVHHPSLESHPQHELAKRQFGGKYGAMLSFAVKNADREKLNAFMKRLEFVHYAMTLGGYRTTIAHPVSSSHKMVPEKDRLAMGVTDGLIRVSVGIEDTDDLITEFLQAVEAFQ